MHHCKKYAVTCVLSTLLFCSGLHGQVDSIIHPDTTAMVIPDSMVNSPISGPTEELQSGLQTWNNNSMSPQNIEETSYNLYVNRSWAKLGDYCNAAIKIEVDYYYLRMRAGIAFFELKQYRKAIPHFQKALFFNKGDDNATRYLYACLLNSERFEEAKRLSRAFSPGVSEDLKSKDFSPVNYVSTESGFKQSDSSTLFKNALFTSVGIDHSVFRKLSLLHNLTYYTQPEYRFKVEQFQYYLKASVPLKNNFLVTGGFHLVKINADLRSVVATVITTTYQPPAPPPPPPGQPPPPAPPIGTITTTVYEEKITNEQKTNYVGALALTKHTPLMDLSIGGAVAYFDTTGQYVANAGTTIFPLKNNKVSIGVNIYYHMEEKVNRNYVAIAPFFTMYIKPKIHITASYLNNPGPNIPENNGSFISNSVDYTTERFVATASFKIASTLWIYGTYGYERKKQLTESFNYSYDIFVFGLKIIPQFK